jgi:hypothetical protein
MHWNRNLSIENWIPTWLETSSNLALGGGLLVASPLGSLLIFHNGVLLPANLVTLLSLINSLVLDGYLYRTVMAACYVLRFQSKVLSAIPLLWHFLLQAVERVVRVLFTLPESLYRCSRLIIRSVVHNTAKYPPASLNYLDIRIRGRVQTDLLRLQKVDDLFWRGVLS